MSFLRQCLGLRGTNPRETVLACSIQFSNLFRGAASPEHANLIDDVLPVTWRLQLLC